MGFHLISIDGDQLRQPAGDHDEFLRNVGAAVVIACLEADTETVSIKLPAPGTSEPQDDPIISVRHVAELDEEDLRLWVWASDEGVAIADLSRDQLELLSKIVASRQRAMSQS